MSLDGFVSIPQAAAELGWSEDQLFLQMLDDGLVLPHPSGVGYLAYPNSEMGDMPPECEVILQEDHLYAAWEQEGQLTLGVAPEGSPPVSGEGSSIHRRTARSFRRLWEPSSAGTLALVQSVLVSDSDPQLAEVFSRAQERELIWDETSENLNFLFGRARVRIWR